MTSAIHLNTSITGRINDCTFTAAGEGTADEYGKSNSKLLFSELIPNFTPMLCASWKCGSHKAIARTADGSVNPLGALLDAGGRLLDRTKVTYPNGWGTIFMTNMLHRTAPDQQFSTQTRLGWYDGPADIVRQLPYTEIITVLSETTAMSYAKRSVVRDNGEVIEIEYFADLVFTAPIGLSGEIRFDFAGEANYLTEERTFTLSADSLLTIAA
jgi:hypothetical protein